ncbi:MAG TPA: hypothetical protein VGQ17_08405 [Gemmatimonadales bacterium]|jgi:uncharacterized membrane protein|nr:hypothetical protein [Gemmatimonadales bacterium]
MNSIAVLLLLRLVHVLSGVFWVGGFMLFARFVFPATRAVGPAAGPVVDQLVRVRKLPRALLGAASLTILSGLGLFWRDSAGFSSAWMASPTGRVFGFGALLSIAAFVVGVSVNNPAAQRLGAITAAIQAQGGPPNPEQAAEMQRLQTRLGVGMQIITVLVLLATAAMALARYA